MESFFASLKTERTARKTYRTREAKADVFDYIECFNNPKRRQSTIGYLSPVESEMQAGSQLQDRRITSASDSNSAAKSQLHGRQSVRRCPATSTLRSGEATPQSALR
jgi:hypothetical protein